MTPTLATQTVVEMTAHVRERLVGLPGVTNVAVQNLVFAWLRKEQPQILEVLSADDVVVVICGSTE